MRLPHGDGEPIERKKKMAEEESENDEMKFNGSNQCRRRAVVIFLKPDCQAEKNAWDFVKTYGNLT